MQEKLFNAISKPNFDPSNYNGLMHNDFQFMRFFPLNKGSLIQSFEKVNSFLTDNGYSAFSMDDFLPELSVKNERVSLYADPFCNEQNKQLILVIDAIELTKNPIDLITLELLKFRNERDWEQFHNSKDLALAINVEAGELLELFLWKNSDDAKREKVKEELADVFSFAFLLAEKYKLDVKEIILEKIKQNAEKYPINKSKGTARKYNEL